MSTQKPQNAQRAKIVVTDKNSQSFSLDDLTAEYMHDGGIMAKILSEMSQDDQDLMLLVCEVGSVRKIERLYGKGRNAVNDRIAIIRQYFWKRILEIEKKGEYDR